MKTLSIRQRVVFWYTAMLILIAVAVFLILRFSSGSQAAAYVSETLHHAAAAAMDEIDIDEGGLEIDHDINDIDYASVMIYDSSGNIMHYGRIPDFDLDFREGEIRRVTGDSGRVWHVYDTLYNVRGDVYVWIRTCMVLDSVINVESYSTRVFLWMIVPLALLAALGGYYITWRAFRPMVRITSTARSIADGDDLTRRIGLTGQKDEFGQLADTFDQMFSRLQSAFEQQKRFASDASHELRTPLSVIRTQCDYALTRGGEADKTQALNVILQQTERMSGLVNQLLLLSRMDSGTQAIQKETLDLSSLMESVADELSSKSAERGITIHKDISPGLYVYADELLMMRMLINLIENAIRFGEEGGYIRLRLKKDGGFVRGSVEDNGIGISEKDMPHIWERFFQADSARTAHNTESSSGLGLPIVKWIICVHGGGISAESTAGHGSIFRFYIPIAAK